MIQSLEHTPMPLALVGADLRLMDINPAAAEYLGDDPLQQGRIIGKIKNRRVVHDGRSDITFPLWSASG